jgi:hypothetical protein
MNTIIYKFGVDFIRNRANEDTRLLADVIEQYQIEGDMGECRVLCEDHRAMAFFINEIDLPVC